MNKTFNLRSLLAVVSLTVLVTPSTTCIAAPRPKQPNVVLILADDK